MCIPKVAGSVPELAAPVLHPPCPGFAIAQPVEFVACSPDMVGVWSQSEMSFRVTMIADALVAWMRSLKPVD